MNRSLKMKETLRGLQIPLLAWGALIRCAVALIPLALLWLAVGWAVA